MLSPYEIQRQSWQALHGAGCPLVPSSGASAYQLVPALSCASSQWPIPLLQMQRKMSITKTAHRAAPNCLPSP